MQWYEIPLTITKQVHCDPHQLFFMKLSLTF